MIVFIIEGILLVLSAIYYALSHSAEWLIFVGLILVAMAVERLITAMQDLFIPDPLEECISIDADTLEWIPTDKALPPEPIEGNYLEYNVVTPAGIPTALIYHGKGIWLEHEDDMLYDSYPVTYWREMPKPPKEVKDE